MKGVLCHFFGFTIRCRYNAVVADNVFNKTKFITLNYLAPRIIKVSMLALGLIWATYHAVEFLDVGLVLIILYTFPIGVALISCFKRKISLNFQQIACMFLLLFGLWMMIYEMV